MDVNPHDVAPAATWAQVEFFRIYKNNVFDQQASLYLFNNTRQQCRVKVAFTALDASGNPVTLSQSEIRQCLRLVDYTTGTPLPFGDTFSSHPEWYSSFTDQGYDWDESIISATPVMGSHDSDVLAPRAQEVVFLVSTSSRSSRSLAVQLASPTGNVIAKTNNAQVNDPDGYGDRQGGFNSSVIIHPSPLGSLPISAYTGTQDGSLPRAPVGDTTNFFKAYEHTIGVQINGTEAELRSVGSMPHPGSNGGFAVYKKGGLSTTMKWSISYYGQPGATQPEHFPLAPLHQVDSSVRSAAHAPTGDVALPGIRIVNRIDQGDVPVRSGDIVIENEVKLATPRPGGETHAIRYPRDMFNTCVGRIESASPYRVVIGLLAANLAGTFENASGTEIPDKPTASLFLMDAYGNEHSLRLGYASIDPLSLTLYKGFGAEDVVAASGPGRSVSKLAVTVENARVFKNDRQQAAIVLQVDVQQDGAAAGLTAEEIQSIRVIDYETREDLPYADDGAPERHRGWSAQAAYRGYDPLSDRLDVATPTPLDETRYVRRYVSAAGDAEQRMYLGFAITVGGVEYETTGWITEPGKEPYKDNAFDTRPTKFVDGIAPQQLGPLDFVLEGNEPGTNLIFDKVVRLAIRTGVGNLRLHAMHAEPAGVVYWQTTSSVNPCCVGHAPPGESALTWPSSFPGVFPDLPSDAAAENGKGTLMVCGRNAAWNSTVPRGDMRIAIVDSQGSDQSCRIRFSTTARGVLEIG